MIADAGAPSLILCGQRREEEEEEEEEGGDKEKGVAGLSCEWILLQLAADGPASVSAVSTSGWWLSLATREKRNPFVSPSCCQLRRRAGAGFATSL